MSNNKIVHVDNVCFSYPDKAAVLSEVSFEVTRGERVALIGPNGSGKTTLFLLLCGILSPASGKIAVNGKGIKHNQFNTDISYLFQSPDDQLFTATVFDDVAFGPINEGLPEEEVTDRVKNALERVGCEKLADKSPHHLSGGEKRMVALATMLSMHPQVMLFDEPTSDLDLRNRRNIITLFASLQKTMIISSHDLEFLLETCNRALVIDNGKIAEDGDIVELLSDEKIMKSHHMEKPHSLYPHTHKRAIPGTTREH
jgi:cobalt/nickel transport system ATP-binding protein